MKSWVMALIVACSASACDAEYGSLRIREGAGEIDAAYVGTDGVMLEEGKVIIVFAEAISATSDNEYEGLERFSLAVVDPDVATIHRGVLRDSFVIAGRRLGQTRLEVLVHDRVQETLPLNVIEQSSVGGGR